MWAGRMCCAGTCRWVRWPFRGLVRQGGFNICGLEYEETAICTKVLSSSVWVNEDVSTVTWGGTRQRLPQQAVSSFQGAGRLEVQLSACRWALGGGKTYDVKVSSVVLLCTLDRSCQAVTTDTAAPA